MDTRSYLRLATALCAIGLAAPGVTNDAVDHMHKHYDAVKAIQAAVISGALDDTREPAQWLVQHEMPGSLPSGGEAYVQAMRTAANAVLDAEDIAAAATATSQLGLACGSCHMANDAALEFEYADRPSEDGEISPHMQRHQWAADRMWEGLIGPSDYAWNSGGNLLFESPLRDIDHDGEDAEWQGMERRIHQLAANATMARGVEKQAEIYAEFLANCAACHQQLDKGPTH